MPTRRTFIKNSTLATAGLVAGLGACKAQAATFSDKKIGIALVGLGNYSETKLAPAFEHAKHCRLAGIVTGTATKEKIWADKYGITKENIYNYENFDKIKDNPNIDAVYVVLPNAMHAEFTIRGAKAGKHVMCEKPMEVSVAKAEAMVKACKDAGKLLQIGYRCQYDPANMELMRLTREKVFGDVKVITSNDSFYGVNSSNWRFTDKALSGGGSLMDIGVYCIQGACYAAQELPVSITAQTFKTFKDKMPGMEETISFQLQFPSGAMANCTSSYVARADNLHVFAEKGNYGLEPAYGYAIPKGYAGKDPFNVEYRNQQAAQMDAFALNILNNTPVLANGEMGVRDMKIIEAIYQAAASHSTVDLKWI